MKWKILLLLFGFLVVGGSVPVENSDVKYADKEFLMKQKFIFDMFRNMYEPLEDEEYLKHSTLKVNEAEYNDFSELSQFFMEAEQNILLEKDSTFVIMKEFDNKQTKMLFQFFYSSKSYEIFAKNVIWARIHCNEGLFIYALTLAVMHRPDLQGIILPAVYEIYPYHFVNTDAMFAALYQKAAGNEGNSIFTSNYTVQEKKFQTPYDGKQEYALTYFTEDVGFNSFYYYFNLEYPFFLGGEKLHLYNDRRGELYLYYHQQLLARYFLERRSHGLPDVEDLDFNEPIKNGYYPELIQHKGLPFYARPDNYKIPKTSDFFKDYEARIRSAIDQGYILMEDGKTKIDLTHPKSIDNLGNLINANPDSQNISFCQPIDIAGRLMLSGSDYIRREFVRIHMAATMHFESMLRDPAYYQLYQRILDLYWQFKRKLPYYSFDEVNFGGVEITGVKIGELRTYFEDFDLDIGNVIPGSSKVMYRNKRINHKPFCYTIYINSDKVEKGIMRVYMGPKILFSDELDDYRKLFVEIDQFYVDLNPGRNEIEKSSEDISWNIKDRTTYSELYQKVMLALDGKEKFKLDMSEAYCGWPDRLLLPKGHECGLEMTFYFFIAKFDENHIKQGSTYDFTASCGTGSGSKYIDDRAFGFPLDREINYGYFYTLKNQHFENVKIYHEDH